MPPTPKALTISAATFCPNWSPIARPIYAYDYQTNKIPGEPPDAKPYWRDVGTIEAYWEANMDMRSVNPALNLYNRQWPLRTNSYPDPPAKFTFDDENRRGEAIDSIVSGGCILSGGRVRNSVLGRGVKVHAGASIEDSVILDNCDIGRRAKIRRAILDKNVRVPPDSTIGYDLEADQRLYHVTETGIVVVEGNRSPGRHLLRLRLMWPTCARAAAASIRLSRYLNLFLYAKSTPTYPFSSRVRIADHFRLKSHRT